MVCCLYVGICFGVVPHHMPDHAVASACHTRPHKIRSQTHELTCEAWHVYIRRGLPTFATIATGDGTPEMILIGHRFPVLGMLLSFHLQHTATAVITVRGRQGPPLSLTGLQ